STRGTGMARRRTDRQTPDLFGAHELTETNAASYEPLPSVWFGTDAELLEKMLDFYPRKRPARILDATVNRGRFWAGSSRPVIGLDIDSANKPDVVGDNRHMPFKQSSFDVVVFDPP